MTEQTISDMHKVVAAVDELGGAAAPKEVAENLSWLKDEDDDVVYDVERAKTAMIAAEEHRLLKSEQRRFDA